YQTAGPGASRFHNQLMADALTHVPHMDAVRSGEGAHTLLQPRRVPAERGRVMIHGEDDALWIVNLGVPPLGHRREIIQRHGCRTVGTQSAVHGADHYVAGAGVLSGPRTEDLFADGLAGHGPLTLTRSRFGGKGHSLLWLILHWKT